MLLARTQFENSWDVPAADHERMPWTAASEYGGCTTVASPAGCAVAAEWTVRLTHCSPLYLTFTPHSIMLTFVISIGEANVVVMRSSWVYSLAFEHVHDFSLLKLEPTVVSEGGNRCLDLADTSAPLGPPSCTRPVARGPDGGRSGRIAPRACL